MSIIKLNAIDSTNDFLKSTIKNNDLDNFTVVVTHTQTKGKGQMGSTWNSEPGKNLIMSVLVKDGLVGINDLFKLNIIVALSIVNTLKKFELKNLTIKWPNDIMAENKKIAGILIENIIKPDTELVSIIGIGLNVNQTSFINLPQASSLALQTNNEFNIDELLLLLIDDLKYAVKNLINRSNEIVWDEYHKNLFKINVPIAFQDNSLNKFMGIIKKVDYSGKLVVALKDDSEKVFELKEIKMLF